MRQDYIHRECKSKIPSQGVKHLIKTSSDMHYYKAIIASL